MKALTDRKVVLVTGTSRGIGRAVAELFARSEFITVGVSRSEGDFKHPNYSHYLCDVGNESEVKKVISILRKEYGRLDVLVNNAAINPAIAPVLLSSISALDAAFATNVRGCFLMCREAAKIMAQNRFGRIINLSSMAVRHEVAGEAIYTATKASVVALSRVLAKEVYELGITCNVIAPAAIETELSKKVNREALMKVLGRNAIPKFGEMQDVWNVIQWLISEKSSAVTGQVIYLGGA